MNLLIFKKKMSDEDNGILTPLSNDPESLTEFAESIGLDPESFSFNEIFSFDDEMLQMIERPVHSVIFLYPVGESDGPLEQRYITEPPQTDADSNLPWFTLQTLPNACGTIAVIHSILNNLSHCRVIPDSWLSKFIEKSKTMTPEERANYIESNDEIQEIHEGAAVEDTTPINDEDAMNHFIAFIEKDGKCWELDGRKPKPICHGPTKDLLNSAVEIIKSDFIPHVDDPLRISAVAFSGNV